MSYAASRAAVAPARAIRKREPGDGPARAPESILALQRAAGNRAVAFALATSGTPATLPRKAQMETAFGTRFDDVRAHLGGTPAQAGLGALGARAAARGNEVVFRDPDPPAELIAHELAHVVQQRRGVAGAADGGGPERAAERAGEAVAAGRPAPDVGVAGSGDVQLARVETAGGEWEATEYKPYRNGTKLGADFALEFEAGDPVVADKIGLVQTVKTEKSSPTGDINPEFADHHQKALATPAEGGTPDAAIDQKQKESLHTNPLYIDESGTSSKNLADGTEKSALGQLGHRRLVLPPSGFDEGPATMTDHPHTTLDFEDQIVTQRFEVAALALDGPFTALYLGSIAWGWKTVPGKYTPDRLAPDIAVVREGSPSGAFAEAAQRWNDATLRDQGRSYETVDLPIADEDTGAMSTEQLVVRLVALRNDTSGDAGPKELMVKTFERELMRRNLRVAVTVTDGSIVGEKVSVNITGGDAPHRTPSKRIGNGKTETFLVSLHELAATMPLTGPLMVDAFHVNLTDDSHRVATATWMGAGTAEATELADGVSYRVVVGYER